jgi:hypothetical protein
MTALLAEILQDMLKLSKQYNARVEEEEVLHTTSCT